MNSHRHGRFIAQQVALVGLCSMLAGCDGRLESLPGDGRSPDRTIGFVLSGYDFLFYTTGDGREECPDGAVYSSKENWQAQFPTPAARRAHFERCGGVDNRGPQCENVLIAPESVQDPLQYREVKGDKAYGSNLDGNEDGRETANTCRHRNFVHPDGTKGIDNQYYRLLGCQRIARAGGTYSAREKEQTIRGYLSMFRSERLLMELREVDSESNDDYVTVAIYHGKDPLTSDAQGNAVPWQSQRIDEDTAPQYLVGRIVNGELITEPADAFFTAVSFFQRRPILVRGAQMRLRLTDTGAEGVRTGYVDAKGWWRERRGSELLGSPSGDSPPALHKALYQLADGYKDPKTGTCSALSSATKLTFVRAYIDHSSPTGAQR